jgi:hypothetical protein
MYITPDHISLHLLLGKKILSYNCAYGQKKSPESLTRAMYQKAHHLSEFLFLFPHSLTIERYSGATIRLSIQQ